MSNRACSRCREISRFLCSPYPLPQSSIARPVLYPASLFNKRLQIHGSGLLTNYSHVPVGNHIYSLCTEYWLQTRIGGQVTHCIISGVCLQQWLLSRQTPTTWRLSQLKKKKKISFLTYCFLFLLRNIPPLLIFLRDPSFATLNLFIGVSSGLCE